MGEDVEALKRRTPLLDYLRQHNWTGHHAGRFEFVGLCPLHEETRPSFYVNSRKDVFYCHGCGLGGDPTRLTPYEAVVRSFAHFQRLNPEEHAASRAALERAVEQQPGYADAWAMLSLILKEEFIHEFNSRPDSLERALRAALRAVEVAPSNHLAYHALASVQFFLGDRPAFRIAAQRAFELNPLDGFTVAFLGSLLAYDGDWERGSALAARARELNPHHPGWYWLVAGFDAYRKAEYRLALEFARKINMSNFWRRCVIIAAAHGQLDEVEEARRALRDLLVMKPDYAEFGPRFFNRWFRPAMVEHITNGLRKAGLEVPDEEKPAAH